MSAPAWLQILVLVFVAGLLLRDPWLIYFTVAVSLIFLLSDWWRRHALDRLNYSRRLRYTRGFPGETTDLRVTIENKKLLPVTWLRTRDAWPMAVAPQDASILAPSHQPEQGYLINLYSLRWFERITRDYSLAFRKRGIYEIGPLTFEGGDMFGLFEREVQVPSHEYLTVFPEILPLEKLHLRAEDPFGERSSPKPVFEDPSRPSGIRPYQPEDGFRHIHWPATARTGSLQSRMYQPISARVMAICMNVTTELHFWLGYNPGLLEHLVKVCATLAYYGMNEGYAVGLFANGSLAHADQPFRIRPGRTPNHLTILLQALAGVTPYVTAPFETFLIRSMTDIPFGSTLVIVTALVSESLQDTLMRLRRYRAHITLISLEQQAPPELPGIQVIHLPYSENQ